MAAKGKIKHLLFEKKIGKIGLKETAKTALLLIGTIYIPVAAIAFISNLSTNTNRYAAILLSAHAFSDYDHWAPPLAFLGSYPAWTLYFNSKNLKTDYFFSATKKDFMDVLLDERYQSIVLVGHGSYNSWRATDDVVANIDVEMMKEHFTKKQGEWFQLSCPYEDYSPVHLGELVMANGNYYYYDGERAGNIDFVLDALLAFRHIKAQTEERRFRSEQG